MDRLEAVRTMMRRNQEPSTVLPPSPAPVPGQRFPGPAVVALLVGMIVFVYVWIVSAGTMTHWPPVRKHQADRDRYALLGQAFLHGQTSLLLQPPPELLALPDPYDPAANEKYRLHDASLYQGKYYYYWGPAPALVTAAIALVTGGTAVPDRDLVFAFVSGLLVFNAFLIWELRRQAFAALPWWTVLPPLLVAGLGDPLPFLLSRPQVYEVAIAGGQCFLLGGLYWALAAFRSQRPHGLRLLLAGVCWTLAVGCRLSLGPVVVILALLVAWRSYRLRPGSRLARLTGPPLLCFGAPLVLGALGLGLYNQARFGSFLETGLRYQLAGFHIPANWDNLFSIRHALPNLGRYCLEPVLFLKRFPFLEPRWLPPCPSFSGRMLVSPDLLRGRLPGMLRVSPFLWLAAVPLLLALGRVCTGLVRGRAGLEKETAAQGSARWTMLCLGVALLGFAPALCANGSNWRYLTDATPALVLLATIGFWQVSRGLLSRRVAGAAWFVAAGTLACLTSLCGVVLAVCGDSDHFPRHNPRLFDHLVRATLPRPLLTEVVNYHGMSKLDGEPFFWLSGKDTVLRVLVRRHGTLRIEAAFFPGLWRPGCRQARVQVRTEAGYSRQVVLAEGRQVIAVPVRSGPTRVVLTLLDLPTAAYPPGMDPRRLMLGVKGIRLRLETRHGWVRVRVERPWERMTYWPGA